MIIDIHVHPERGSAREAAPEQQAERLLARADRVGVDQVGLLGVVTPGQNEQQVRQRNDLTINMVRARPDRLFGLCFVNPTLPPESVAGELDRCLGEGGLKGIKLELDLVCRDQRLDLLMEKAAAYDVPVLHHCWYLTPSDAIDMEKQRNRSEPPDIRDLAQRFPNVKIIMAHLTGCGMRGVLDVKDLPNVYIDTSGGQPEAGIVEYAVQQVGPERVIYGSDMHGRDFSSQLGRIYGARLNKRQRERILHRNARELGLQAAN